MFRGGPPPPEPRSAELARLLLLLGHSALDVKRVERQAAGSALNPIDLRDLHDISGRHRELRRRDEGVARELVAGVAQVLEPKATAAVLSLQLLPLFVRQSSEWPVARIGKLNRSRHGHVRADTREWLKDFGLGVVESLRERGHGDDQADADAKAQRRQGSCVRGACAARRTCK